MSTTTYAVLLPGDEAFWESASREERAEGYARHQRFIALLGERGHRFVAGAELTHSRDAHRIDAGPEGGTAVTEGPFAETTEQLTGFYLVESDELDDLLALSATLAGPGHDVVVRAAVDPSARDR